MSARCDAPGCAAGLTMNVRFCPRCGGSGYQDGRGPQWDAPADPTTMTTALAMCRAALTSPEAAS